MEIFLGPQPVPFIRNRQRLPSGDSEAPAPTPPSPPTMAFPKVSKWRQEQMKKAKSARPVPGSRERPIPLLHGPLSLPYARNPR